MLISTTPLVIRYLLIRIAVLAEKQSKLGEYKAILAQDVEAILALGA